VNKSLKVLHLQDIANQLPNAFSNSKGVTKSHILAINAPARIELSVGQSTKIIGNKSMACLKRGGPTDSKDKNPKTKEQIIKLALLRNKIFMRR
jgi:hypothetical protein